MPGRYRFGIATIAVLFLASVFLLFGGLMLVVEWLTQDQWIETDARVLSTRTARETVTSGRSAGKQIDVRYVRISFPLPDGRTVTTGLRNDAAADTTIRILYNRHDPTEVRRTDLPGEWAAALFMVALGALCLVIAHFVALSSGPVQRQPASPRSP